MDLDKLHEGCRLIIRMSLLVAYSAGYYKS